MQGLDSSVVSALLASALISGLLCMCEHSHMYYIKTLVQAREWILRTEEEDSLILVLPSACLRSPIELSACCCFPLQQMATLIWFH